MILFTSDLDRTLIFSERTIEMLETERICIEQLNDKKISYVTKEICDQLEMINNTMQFVPVTSRSRAQYERIILFRETIIPSLAIVANGGIILRNGQVDKAWQQHIEQMMANLPLPITEVQQYFAQQLNKPYFLQHQLMDDLFFVYGVNLTTVNFAELQELKEQLAPYGWTSYLNGRKLYIMPIYLTKGMAVAHIKEQIGFNYHVAAGDSFMDLSMLTLADRSFAPAHGEITEMSPIEILNKKGAAFAEQCLGEIIQSSLDYKIK
jgi:hydroxymethylpyrimidine pyrophosphatase-like HAD family hydrolase